MFQLPIYTICIVVGLVATNPGSQSDSDTQSNRPVDVVVGESSADVPVVVGDQDRLTQLAKRFTSAHSQLDPDLPSKPSASIPTSTATDNKGFSENTPLGPRHAGHALAAKNNVENANSQWWLRTLAALGAVIGLILLLRAIVSKVSGRPVATAASQVFEVLIRTSITPRNHLLLIRIGQRLLVVGQSPAGLNTLANIEGSEEVAELLLAVTAAGDRSVSSGFAQLFKRFNGEYHQEQIIADEGADNSEYHIDRARDRVSGLIGQLRSFGAKGNRK